jgi:uncharacterized protein YoaH (UPF0181 family)
MSTYHSNMRHWLLILMIALLPARGWIGDAMATGMAAGHAQQIAAKTIAINPHGQRAESHFEHDVSTSEVAQAVPDCAGHASSDTPTAADAHCESCSACQACHTLALSPATVDSLPVFQAFHPSPAAVPRFASAEAALGQKPPIS